MTAVLGTIAHKL